MANSPQLTPKIETAAKNSSPSKTVEVLPSPRPKLASSQNFGRCEEFRNLVEKYDWNANTMLAIARAESGCNPLADNTGLNRDGTNDKGLFQINSIHGFSDAERLDPVRNTEIAYRIWKSQSYRAWSAFNNGSYLNFLK